MNMIYKCRFQLLMYKSEAMLFKVEKKFSKYDCMTNKKLIDLF